MEIAGRTFQAGAIPEVAYAWYVQGTLQRCPLGKVMEEGDEVGAVVESLFVNFVGHCKTLAIS